MAGTGWPCRAWWTPNGICSNNTARMFDVIHACGFDQRVTSPDDTQWLTASEVLHAATLAGARSALIGDQTRSLEVGKRADLLVLDTRSWSSRRSTTSTII